MAVIPVYQEIVEALHGGDPILPKLGATARHCLDALEETYGPALCGPGGLETALTGRRARLLESLEPAAGLGLEAVVERSLALAAPLLPGGSTPDLYLSTLMFTAPVIGMERFHPDAISLNPGRNRPP